MFDLIKPYFAALITTIALDYVWLGLVMVKFYQSSLGPLARRAGEALSPIWWAAGVVYLIIPLGVVLFVLPRATGSNPLLTAALFGFAFGVVSYGIYDFTNYSTLAGWPLALSLVDVVWGGVVCAGASVAATLASK